jgi:hypothetical protein
VSRASTSLVVAALLAVGSCNGSNGGTDGGGGGGGGMTGGSGGHTGGSGGALGGSGGHASGGQGGIDNLCLTEGQSCGATGPLCCSPLMCCYDGNGQASCVQGSCTGSQGGNAGDGGAGGKGAGGAAGGSGGNGTGGAGGSQMFSCGSDTCTTGESFCYTYTPGTAGQTGRSCETTPAACAATPTSCTCLCPPSSNASLGCVPVGMGAGSYCLCSETGGAVNIVCAGV